MRKINLFPFIAGLLLGAFMALAGEVVIYKKRGNLDLIERAGNKIAGKVKNAFLKRVFVEDFSQAVPGLNGQSFGMNSWLTLELFRNGKIIIDGASKPAVQKSDSYRDSAYIRTTDPLPKTYKVWAVVGEIQYGLENIAGLPQDPEYPEGPQNENGCYLLAITDELPQGHHTNTWWHQHRKVVIDVDNNTGGHGMPNPIFMAYFNRDNRLRAFDGQTDSWQKDWKKAVTYDPKEWYKVEIEKTDSEFILSIYREHGELIKRGRVPLDDVWNADHRHPEYLVIGDPHENYYQGSLKVKKIGITF